MRGWIAASGGHCGIPAGTGTSGGMPPLGAVCPREPGEGRGFVFRRLSFTGIAVLRVAGFAGGPPPALVDPPGFCRGMAGAPLPLEKAKGGTTPAGGSIAQLFSSNADPQDAPFTTSPATRLPGVTHVLKPTSFAKTRPQRFCLVHDPPRLRSGSLRHLVHPFRQ